MIFFVIVFGIYPLKSNAAIQDVPVTYWAAYDIHFLVEKNIWLLDSSGLVRPNDFITGGETIEIIARALQLPVIEDETKNISSDEYLYDVLQQFVRHGIIKNQAEVKLHERLKRDQLVKMLALAFEVKVDDVHKSHFHDVHQDHWARNYILTLADIGIIHGKGNKLFAPNDFVTRAQLAKMLVKMMQFKEAEKNNEVIYDYLSKHYIETKNDFAEWEHEIIKLINNIRIANQVAPLKRDPALTQLAIIKAQNMLDQQYFDHYSPLYGNPWDMAFVFDYHFFAFGENIARHFTSPNDVVNAWMASPGHRENILKINYTHIGVGTKKQKDNNFYIVNHFSKK